MLNCPPAAEPAAGAAAGVEVGVELGVAGAVVEVLLLLLPHPASARRPTAKVSIEALGAERILT
jgi:hypothetical protein